MSGEENLDSESQPVVQRYDVPVLVTDNSIFDGAFTFMKERFAEEMRRIEEEMTKFSKNLLSLYGDTMTVQTGLVSNERKASAWEVITSSPLVEDDGDDKMLKLQFDVSQFEPHEVNVRILNEMLVVSAVHKEKTDNSTVYSEYNREFLLPNGTDPESVESVVTKEGVLTVRAPLHFS